MIQYNPLLKSDGTANGALTSVPSASIVYDLPGKVIYVKGVKFKGTDHTYTFSHDNYITLTITPSADEGNDVQIGVDIQQLKAQLLSEWAIEVNKASYSLTHSWTDSDVDLSSLSPGICALHVNYAGVHYSGIFTYSGQYINTDDEIVLHQCGTVTLGRGRLFAKISAVSGVAKLMFSASVAETNISLFNIKIKQIATL